MMECHSLLVSEAFEKVQRHATIICQGAYRHTENQTLLHEVGLAPLTERMKIHKLTKFYKINSGIYLTYLIRDYIPVASEPCYTFRSGSHIPYIPCRLILSINYQSVEYSSTHSPLQCLNQLSKDLLSKALITLYRGCGSR